MSATNYFKTYSPAGVLHGVFPFVDGDEAATRAASMAALECQSFAESIRAGRTDHASEGLDKGRIVARAVSCWTRPICIGPWSSVPVVAPSVGDHHPLVVHQAAPMKRVYS